MSFTDDFNRADSATVGNGWTEIGTPGGEILSNKMRQSGGTYYTDMTVAPASADMADGTLIVDFVANATNTTPQMWFRLDTSASNVGYIIYYSGSNLSLARHTGGGSLTDIGNSPQSAGPLAAATNYRFTVTLDGTNITGVLRNLDTSSDRATITVTGESTYNGQEIALGNNSNSSVDYDNFSATAAGGGSSIIPILLNLTDSQTGGSL